MKHARDLALEKLIEMLESPASDLDPRVALDVATKLSVQIDLLEGRATSRAESNVTVDVAGVRDKVMGLLGQVKERRRLMDSNLSPIEPPAPPMPPMPSPGPQPAPPAPPPSPPAPPPTPPPPA